MAEKSLMSLQAGRALAAGAVVIHHANLASRDFAGWWVPALDAGYLGVDFFFVLSGFIISWTAPGKTPAAFVWHRVRRVVLPYFPLGVGIAILYTFFPSVSGGDRSWSWLATLTLLPINAHPALSVAWTLQHELLFYSLFLAFRFSGRLYWGLGLWALAILIATAFGIHWLALSSINLEFIMGVGACEVVRRQWGSLQWFVMAVLPAALWAATGSVRNWSLLVGLSVALCIPPIVRMERDNKLIIPNFLVFFGAASYSIYLAHGLAISIGARFLPTLPIGIVSGVFGGLAYYLLVERPILRFVPRSLP